MTPQAHGDGADDDGDRHSFTRRSDDLILTSLRDAVQQLESVTDRLRCVLEKSEAAPVEEDQGHA